MALSQAKQLTFFGIADVSSEKHSIADTKVLDINGDGRMDYIWVVRYYKGSNHRVYYGLSDGEKIVHQKYTNGANHLYFWPDQNYPLRPSLKLAPLDYNG